MNAPELKTIADADHDRRRFLGGSDAAAVIGLSKFRTPYQVYLSKTSDTREELDPERKKFFERRKRWEPVIIQSIKEDYDAEIVATNRRYVDPEFPFMAAEIDFEYLDVATGQVENGEAKTVHPHVFKEAYGWGEAGSGDIPIDYWTQVQHGLGVTRRRRTVVAAMVGLDDPIFYLVERDDEDIAKIRAALVKFWNEHVLKRVAPEPINLADVKRMFRQAKVLSLPAGDALALAALRLRAVKSNLEALKMEEEALEFEVCRGMGEHDELTVDGRKLATWKEENWSRLDQAGMKTKYPKIQRELTLSGKHRVFRTLKS